MRHRRLVKGAQTAYNYICDSHSGFLEDLMPKKKSCCGPRESLLSQTNHACNSSLINVCLCNMHCSLRDNLVPFFPVAFQQQCTTAISTVHRCTLLIRPASIRLIFFFCKMQFSLSYLPVLFCFAICELLLKPSHAYRKKKYFI